MIISDELQEELKNSMSTYFFKYLGKSTFLQMYVVFHFEYFLKIIVLDGLYA